MKDRSTKILEIVTREKKVEVKRLAEELGVSNVTMRKDLDDLQAKGVLKREHGYAVMESEDDINSRLAWHYEEKRKIAKKAVSLISEGETVMIESGSCCTLLAEEIAETFSDITIVTNSAFIADYIRKKSSVNVILLGGVYQNDSQVCVGPLTASAAKNFFVDKFFIGTDGYDERIGFTNKDHLRAQAVKDMAEQAERVIILTESSKFEGHGVVPLNINDKIKTVITDTGITEAVRKTFESRGIEVFQAK